MSSIPLNLYSKPDCHLCDIALSLIEAASLPDLVIEKVDISGDKHLMVKYGIKIPVLKHVETGKELGWPFGEPELRGWLESLGGVTESR